MMLRYLLRLVGMFKETARLPSVGEPFRLMYVTDLAYVGGPETAQKLIDYSLNMAYSRKSNFLCFAFHPTEPLSPIVTKYRPIEMKYELYGKWLTEKNPRKLGTTYIDPVDHQGQTSFLSMTVWESIFANPMTDIGNR
jgi:hypothetical protein